MTINTELSKRIYTGNGVKLDYDYDFKIPTQGDLAVSLFDLNGVEYPQVLDTDYEITGAGSDNGGQVIFSVPPTDDWTILLISDAAYTQPTDFKNQGRFFPETHENSYDRGVILARQLKELSGRTLRIPAQVQGVDTALPVPVGGALFGWAGDLSAVINYTLSDLAVAIGIPGAVFVPQTITATTGQTVFDLTYPYAKGIGALSVYCDGLKLRGGGIDYTETSATTITLTSGAVNGQQFEFVHGQNVSTAQVDVAGITYQAPGSSFIRTQYGKNSDIVSVKDFGAVGDTVTDDTAAIASTMLAVTDSAYYPSGIYGITSKPAGFTTRRRAGPGIVRTPDGDVYPDDDVLRYSPNMDIGDFKLTVARNNANLNADASKRGHYFAQEYESTMAGAGSLFGYVGNIKRTGGVRKVVPGQFNGYNLSSSTESVWGIATEAWNGDATTAGTVSSPLIGAEMSVISQYNANAAAILGTDVVFKNRPDGAAATLFGLGSNAFNRNSVGVRISSQARGTDTAFCGWRKGIEFTANSLDESTDGRAIGIDLSLVPATRLLAAVKFANDQPVIAGSRSSTVFDGWRYVNDGGGTRIEFVRGIETGGTNTVKAKIDLGNNANTNAWVLTQAGTRTTIGATGAATALPANPLGYFDVRLVDGTAVAIPYYTRGA